MKIHINKEVLKVFAGGLAFTVVISLGARKISDKFTCHVEEVHAHKYTAIGGLERYAISENTIYDLMLKSKNEIKTLSEEEVKFINFLDDNDLFIIEDNLETIKEKVNINNDFTEYEHNIEKIDNKGKKYVDKKWSRNNYQCNGNARDCFYTYEAYKIKKVNGTYQLEKSEKVSNILDIKDEYPYIKTNYYQIVKGDIYQIEVNNKTK